MRAGDPCLKGRRPLWVSGWVFAVGAALGVTSDQALAPLVIPLVLAGATATAAYGGWLAGAAGDPDAQRPGSAVGPVAGGYQVPLRSVTLSVPETSSKTSTCDFTPVVRVRDDRHDHAHTLGFPDLGSYLLARSQQDASLARLADEPDTTVQMIGRLLVQVDGPGSARRWPSLASHDCGAEDDSGVWSDPQAPLTPRRRTSLRAHISRPDPQLQVVSPARSVSFCLLTAVHLGCTSPAVSPGWRMQPSCSRLFP
jgi:hypothetical protein